MESLPQKGDGGPPGLELGLQGRVIPQEGDGASPGPELGAQGRQSHSSGRGRGPPRAGAWGAGQTESFLRKGTGAPGPALGCTAAPHLGTPAGCSSAVSAGPRTPASASAESPGPAPRPPPPRTGSLWEMGLPPNMRAVIEPAAPLRHTASRPLHGARLQHGLPLRAGRAGPPTSDPQAPLRDQGKIKCRPRQSLLPPGLPLRGSPTQAHTRSPARCLWLALPHVCVPTGPPGPAHSLPPHMPLARLRRADTRPWVNEPWRQTYSLVMQGSDTRGYWARGHQFQ